MREYFAEKGIEVAGFVQWQPYGGGGAIDPETGVPEVPGLPNPNPNPNTIPNPKTNPNPNPKPNLDPNPNPNRNHYPGARGSQRWQDPRGDRGRC